MGKEWGTVMGDRYGEDMAKIWRRYGEQMGLDEICRREGTGLARSAGEMGPGEVRVQIWVGNHLEVPMVYQDQRR